jgi:hypothetical protein
MKKFKLIFYPIYLIVVTIVIYYSVDMLQNMDEYLTDLLRNGHLSKVPKYSLSVFLALASLMVVELIVENVHVFLLKGRAEKAEKEVLELKAKLYDKSQLSPSKKAPAISEDLDSDSEETVEADDWV